MSWWWRTKPRSILRTIQWFSCFGKLENENWDKEDLSYVSSHDGSKIHPVRRQYIYDAHSAEDQDIGDLTLAKYLSGQYDKNETESNGRNDKITYEFFGFGYVKKDGNIAVTDVGRRILENKFDNEDFLKQLLKLQFPNNVSNSLKGFEENDYIFPLELFCKAIERFEYLNRSEIVLLFGCHNNSQINNTLDGIACFRQKYNKLLNKNNTSDVRQLCFDTYVETHGSIDNKINTYYDYAEAFCRCLIYTGIFNTSGRSIATKIRVPDHAKVKFNMILKADFFKNRRFDSLEDYMKWFGDPSSIKLPWDSVEARKLLISDKIDNIYKLKDDNEFGKKYKINKINIDNKVKEASVKIKSSNNSIEALKDIENDLANFITSINEQQYIDVYSKTDEAKQEILDMYDDIIATIDMGALWLEVNTWKSLLAINGDKKVKRNFHIEEDLSPRSFAPGIGNTPDMEMYTDDYVIIPEVSLMTGVRQWEHEASSVIDHVLSFIEEYKNKKVLGLFISSSINIRTKWQFFILNKESWIGHPVPVIPLTIKQYKDVISVIYSNNKNISDFISLIDNIHQKVNDLGTYDRWYEDIDQVIDNWKVSMIA